MEVDESHQDYKIASNPRHVEDVQRRIQGHNPAALFSKIQQLEKWAMVLEGKEQELLQHAKTLGVEIRSSSAFSGPSSLIQRSALSSKMNGTPNATVSGNGSPHSKEEESHDERSYEEPSDADMEPKPSSLRKKYTWSEKHDEEQTGIPPPDATNTPPQSPGRE